jgi:hypothetical protein
MLIGALGMLVVLLTGWLDAFDATTLAGGLGFAAVIGGAVLLAGGVTRAEHAPTRPAGHGRRPGRWLAQIATPPRTMQATASTSMASPGPGRRAATMATRMAPSAPGP